MKKYYLLLGILVFHWGLSTAQTRADTSLNFGVNLAGAEFGKGMGVHGKDYAYPSVADLDYFKSKGLPLIRLPFKWERIQPLLNGALNEAELGRLVGVVKAAQERGMQVIPDLHNYCRRRVDSQYLIIGEGPLRETHLANLWGRLAKALRAYDNIYGYGLMNEPHDMLPTAPWSQMAQACISEIRRYDSLTPILIGGNSWSSAERWVEESDHLRHLYDPSNQLIFEAHVYFDADASGIYKRSYDAEGTQPYTGVVRVSPFIKWLHRYQLRGFIGEFGIPGDDVRWQVCLDHFLSYLQQSGVNGTYWAAGPIWKNYILSVQPGQQYKQDAPQIKVLQRYPHALRKR